MRKIITKDNFKPEKGQTFKLPSKTIKGESYTIQELIEKHTAGIRLPIDRQPIYMDDASHEDIDLEKAYTLDNVDKAEIKASAKQMQITLEQSIKDVQKEKKRQDLSESKTTDHDDTDKRSADTKEQSVD